MEEEEGGKLAVRLTVLTRPGTRQSILAAAIKRGGIIWRKRGSLRPQMRKRLAIACGGNNHRRRLSVSNLYSTSKLQSDSVFYLFALEGELQREGMYGGMQG